MKTNIAWGKRFAAGAAFIVCIGAALTLEADVMISSLAPATGAEVTNGAPVTVTAQLATNDGSVVQSVELAYAWNGGDWNTQTMSEVSGTNYAATILPAVSSLAFYVTCRYDTTGVVISATNAVSTTLPDYARYADFDVTNAVAMDNAWVNTPGTSNWVYTIGSKSWTAEKAAITNVLPTDQPPGGSNTVLRLNSLQGGGSYAQTPYLAEGVGTIYYTSVMSDAGFSARMIIQYTTNSLPENWQDAWTNNYNNYPALPVQLAKTTNAIPVVLNNRNVRYVRFWRTDDGWKYTAALPATPLLGSIYIDNLSVSRPPTDVTLTQLLQNPGYPSQDQEVRVRCQVNDVDSAIPSVNRRVTVIHSWGQTNLVPLGGGVYEGVIPRHGVGTNSYYFTCDFDGYSYSRDPDGSACNLQTNRNERIGRAVLGQFEYGIRPFQSDVRVMQVVTNVSGSVIPMELVGDYLWRGRIPIQGITSQSWTFAGVAGYTNNAAGYAAAPWTWGDNVTPPNPTNRPFNGIAERDVTTEIVIAGLTDGLLTITVNSTNGSYNASQTYVTSAILSPVGGTGLTNGAPVTVVVQLAVAYGASVVTGSVVFSYAWNNGSVITQAMTAVAGTNLYTATIPPAVTSLSYSVAWQYTLDGSTYAGGSSETSNIVSSTLLDYARYADFDVTNAVAMDNAWVNTLGTSNWVYTIGSKSWTAEKAAIVLPATNDQPPGGSNKVIRLNSLQGGGSYAQTPYLAEGVGTIYYTSVMSDAGYSARMIIQYTTNSSPENWKDAWTNNYNNYPALPMADVKATNAVPVVLTNRNVRYVRFWRTDNGKNSSGALPIHPDVGSIYIDNIYVSRPPTDVVITQMLQNPGYPATNQAVTVRCQVNDVDSEIPSVNRLVQVHYSWNNASGPWTQTNMVLNGAGVYERTIPQLGAGTNYYYFTCDFDGYSYSRDPDGPACDLQTNRNERIGRAELKQFEYAAIRPFQSDVRVMQVVTNVSASAIPMELAGDYLWRVRTPIRGITGLICKFSGVEGYTNNAAGYAVAPWVWGDDNQASTVPPITNGMAGRAETANIVITNLAAGFLMIEMNGTNGRYSVVAEEIYVAPQFLSPAGGAGLSNGSPVTVVVRLTAANGAAVVTGSVVLAYAWNNGSVITQAMTAVAGTNLYTVTLPPAVTSLSYSVTWQYTLDGSTYAAGSSVTSNAVSSTLLDYVRYADFEVTNAVAMDNAWVQTPGTTNWVYTIGSNSWTANQCRMPIPTVLNCPPGGTNRVIQLLSRNASNSYVRTPYLAEGVGTIYYTSIMSEVGYSARMIIQYTTNSLPENWQNAWTNNYNNYPALPTQFTKGTNAIPVVLNNRNVRYVRFWRTDYGLRYNNTLPTTPLLGSIYIDNIYVSRPPTDVVITQLLQNPGYPAQDQDVTVRCQVDEVDSAIPSVNRLVQVHYSWNNANGPWTQTNMVLNGAGVYEWTIPQLGEGTNYYYFTCDFDGYSYSRDPDGPACNLQANRNERIGRAELKQLKYAIRPFRSDVRVMQVVTNVSASAIPMELVSNHLWRVQTPVQGITSQSWTFAGVEGYTNGAAGYAAAPWTWGDNVTPPNPASRPFNGIAERDVTNKIVIAGLSDGLLTITVNSTNGSYNAAQPYVTSQFLSPAGGAGLTNGSPVTVVVQLTAAYGAAVVTGSVVLSYAWNNGSVITQAMTAVAGTNLYTVTLPPALNSLSYSVAWQYTLNDATYAGGSSETFNIVSSTLLDYVRYADFDVTNAVAMDNAWVNTPGTSNWVYTIGSKTWVAEKCGIISPTLSAERPPGGSNRVLRLFSLQGGGSYAQTPYLAEGVGTIYYTSVMSGPGFSAQMIIQYTTNSLPENWQNVQTNNYNNYPALAEQFTKGTNASPVVLNNRNVRYVRFWRTDNGTKYNGALPDLPTLGALYLDSIYISRPPTGVTLTEKLYNPGYPAQDQDVKVRCQVDDVDLTVPSVNRRVKVWYSWQSESGPWAQTDMVAIAERVYEGVIPQHGAGRMYYKFQCDLDGYFYSRDPDGPTGPQPTRDEKIGRSPGYLIEKGEDNYRNYEIRRYQSDIEAMQVICSNVPSASINTLDLVGDHVWQGLTLVSGITNLLWTFVGTNRYVNDAEAFDPNVLSWGDNDQDFPEPPVAGHAERDATNSIRADLVYNGTLLIRMNEQTGEYIIKRGVYQDFDDWPASQTDFEQSFGLFTIQTFKQDFNTNGWGYGYDAYSPSRYVFEPVDTTEVTDFVRGSPALTFYSWAYDYARVVRERNVLTDVRRAIELEGGALRGHVWNTSTSKTLGIENFGFKARLSLNDRYFTYFKGGTNGFNPFVESPTWPKGYWVEAQFRAASLSPGMASCSVLTWFTPGASTESGEPSYYETRVTQADPTGLGASQLQLALYRWKDGVGAPVGTPRTYFNTLNTPMALRVQMPASGNTITTLVGRIDESTGTNIWDYLTVFTDPTLWTNDIGTVGFGSYDAQPDISSVRVFDFTNRVNLLPGDNWGAAGGLNSTNWNMGGKRISTDGAFRWRISSNSLVRDIPSQTLKIYTYPMPSGNNWHPDDFRTRSNVTNLVVTSLGYTPFVVPITVWDPHFVEIQNAAAGEINAVVDELSLSPWRAVTRSDKTMALQEAKVDDVLYYNWTSQSQQEKWSGLPGNTGWLVMEGRISTSAGSRGSEAQFIRSRANTNLVQALVSPYLTNNIGSIAFDWRASDVGNVVFAIDRTDRLAYPAWDASPVLIVTNDALSGTVNLSIRTNYPGRIRIRLCEGTAPDTVFKIDNLVVRDYPPRDDTSWQAYNALITEAQPSRAFEPTKPGAQTAFLNNDPMNEVAKNERLDAYQPFIQTPKVGTGIGEITFWYRIWDTIGGPAVISLQAAKDENGPWNVLTNIVVASTQTSYLVFSNDQIYERDYKVLRIYGSTNANRVCIDNVLMTEPVRAGYEFRLVGLLPAQPLVGEPPGLKVELGRFIMNPTNIHVYASWFVGTNTWGYTNWWSTSYPKVELTNSPGAPRVFQTPDNVVLPAGAVDDVVQFFVWGVHGGIDISHGDRPILQETNAFVNPPWYYPADLNALTPKEPGLPALGSRGWSPYYYVYSCPPGSVWVNELRYFYWDWPELDTEFIEIIGPAEASLGRWQLQMMSTENNVFKESVISQDFVLKNATNGWGFLIWGDDAMSSYGDHILFPDWAAEMADIPQVGGVRVVRSNGAWEDRVAWGYGAESLVSQYGYTYAGARDSEYTLSMRSISTNLGSKASDFTWGTVEATPHAINKFQRLFDNSAVPIGFYMIYSAIGPHGTHSLGPNALESVEIAPGGSTNIVYTADTWYRIGTMLTNGVSVGAAPGLKVYTQAFVNVRSAISNQVTFTYANSAQTGLTNSVPIPWASAYYPASEAAAVANTNIARDYLLNIIPTNSHVIAFAIKSITVSNAVSVTVKLADGGNPLSTTINGAVKLYGKPTLKTAGWNVIAAATVSNANFNASGTYTLPAFPTQTNTFFRAIIE